MSRTKGVRLGALAGLLVLVAAGYALVKPKRTHDRDANRQAAMAAQGIMNQLSTYPLTNCVVMTDEKLAGEAVNFVYNGRLVRFCCNDCISKFEKEPAKYLASLDSAGNPPASPGEHTGHEHRY